MVVGCYRPPSANSSTLSSLRDFLSSLNYNEIVLLGDLNWNWLLPMSDHFKSFCNSFNLFQIVNSPTRPNLKHPEKSSLIDLILTNASHKYYYASVFANDISDHCLIASVRNTKIPKTRPRIIFKRATKQFSMQGFLNDLYDFDWGRISLIDDVEKFFMMVSQTW